jgi:hypothetical protein
VSDDVPFLEGIPDVFREIVECIIVVEALLNASFCRSTRTDVYDGSAAVSPKYNDIDTPETGSICCRKRLEPADWRWAGMLDDFEETRTKNQTSTGEHAQEEYLRLQHMAKCRIDPARVVEAAKDETREQVEYA